MGMLQLSSSSYESVSDLPSFSQTLFLLILFHRRVMTATRVTRQERRERPVMAVGNASLSLLF